jgi:hypothetical protein
MKRSFQRLRQTSMTWLILGAFGIALLNTSCVSSDQGSLPVPPPEGSAPTQPDPGVAYYRHYLQLIWSNQDLSSLASLQVNTSGGVDVMPVGLTPAPAPTSRAPGRVVKKMIRGNVQAEAANSLTFYLPIDIQKDNHDALASAFASDLQRGSALNGANPYVNVPKRDCQETFNARGEIETIQGVCVRSIELWIPGSPLVSLNLSWIGGGTVSSVNLANLGLTLNPASMITLTNVATDVSILGGAPDAEISVDRLNTYSDPSSGISIAGSFAATLSQVGKVDLSSIAGGVFLSLTNSAGANVNLDGKAISTFPFQRP